MSTEVVDAVARARIEAHEDICAARYIELQQSLNTLNGRLFTAGGGIMLLLVSVIITLIVTIAQKH